MGETTNLTEAALIAAVLERHGAHGDAVIAMDDFGWYMAADLAHVPAPSPATRSAVVTILDNRAANRDPFHGFDGLRLVPDATDRTS